MEEERAGETNRMENQDFANANAVRNTLDIVQHHPAVPACPSFGQETIYVFTDGHCSFKRRGPTFATWGFTVKGKGDSIEKTFEVVPGAYTIQVDVLKVDSWDNEEAIVTVNGRTQSTLSLMSGQ